MADDLAVPDPLDGLGGELLKAGNDLEWYCDAPTAADFDDQ
jgi:hypothetical protein